jgi:hypothetical protein
MFRHETQTILIFAVHQHVFHDFESWKVCWISQCSDRTVYFIPGKIRVIFIKYSTSSSPHPWVGQVKDFAGWRILISGLIVVLRHQNTTDWVSAQRWQLPPTQQEAPKNYIFNSVKLTRSVNAFYCQISETSTSPTFSDRA